VGRSLAGVDLAAAEFRFGDWAVSVAAADFEFYHRPAVHAKSSYGGQVYYSNDFDQTGALRGLAFSLARRFGDHLSVGLTVIAFQGDFSLSSTEISTPSGYTITDSITRKYSGLAFQGGIAWEIGNGVILAATLRGPWTKKADGASVLRYQAPAGSTDILIPDSARDSLRQPWIAGLGLSFRPLDGLTASAEGIYYGWSRYAPEYFGEVQDRNFRDIVRIGAGLEYKTTIRLFGRDVEFPNRIGIVYDPQPMSTPRSSYVYATFGTGLHWRTFHVDLGISLGGESGSGYGLAGRRIALTFGYFLGERP
jgi:long-subunit fatty acid transport protein